MKVIIKDYKDNQVLFESEYRIGFAMWNGDMPSISQELHVEIDVNVNLVFGLDVYLSNSTSGEISCSKKSCIIVGKIESIDEDNYVTVRIGENILCCVIEGLSEIVGKFIEIRTSFLELTNINY